jgi:hypothetical protein
MSRYKLTLFADYHQFYIQDETADGNLSDAWTDEAVERLLAPSALACFNGAGRDTETAHLTLNRTAGNGRPFKGNL